MGVGTAKKIFEEIENDTSDCLRKTYYMEKENMVTVVKKFSPLPFFVKFFAFTPKFNYRLFRVY